MIEITEARRAQAREERIAMLRRLVARMRLIRAVDADHFVAPADPGAFDRVYGGLMLADALMAAAATVPEGRRVHSVHILLSPPRRSGAGDRLQRRSPARHAHLFRASGPGRAGRKADQHRHVLLHRTDATALPINGRCPGRRRRRRSPSGTWN